MPRLLTGVAGADGLAILRDAVKMGASVVGGVPDSDPDPDGLRRGRPGGRLRARLPGRPAHRRCRSRPARPARRDGGRPAAGRDPRPLRRLSRLPADAAARAADHLAARRQCGLPAPGRLAARTGRGAAPVRLLRAAGVRVAAGSGALRDVANPVGRGDPLEAAYLLASRHGLRAEDAYDTVSTAARGGTRAARGAGGGGFPPNSSPCAGTGSRALSLAYSRIVVHRGRVVARTSAVREYCDPLGARGRCGGLGQA